jgi:hypothetical protein
LISSFAYVASDFTYDACLPSYKPKTFEKMVKNGILAEIDFYADGPHKL